MGFWRSVTNQRRVIWALIVRELQVTRGSKRGGYIRALTRPLTLLVMLLFVRSAIRNSVGVETLNSLVLVSGFLVFFLWRGIASKLQGLSNTIGGIFIFPQVTAIKLFIAQSAIIGYIHAFLLTVIVGIIHFFVNPIPTDNIQQAFLGVVLAWLNGLGAGLTTWGLVTLVPAIQFVPNIIFKVMFWITGVFFSASSLPLSVQNLARWNPVTICLEMTRHGLGLPTQSMFLRPGYAFLCGFGLVVLGTLLGRYAWRGRR